MYKIIWAGMLSTGLFMTGCENSSQHKPNTTAAATQNVEKLTFDCLSDSLIPLGYIDTSWSYINPPLGIKFKFPKGWNITEDIAQNGPTIVPVGDKLSAFREQYTRQHYLKLSFMKGAAWNERRYLFGVTHQPPIDALDTAKPDYIKNSLLTGHVFYGAEFSGEEDLYKKIVRETKNEWSYYGRDDLAELNKTNINRITKLAINGVDFYAQTIKIPTEHGLFNNTSVVKKMDCLFLVVNFIWQSDKDRAEMMQLLKGLWVSSSPK
jgi:hypothetical protein